MADMLLNVSHVKSYIRRRQPEIRPGFQFERISRQAIEDIDTKVRLIIDASLKAHPSVGKTFTHIQ
ncbi:MAG: hypothetical protein ACYS8Z_26020 [Planctomycetota bacterium]|jgi:hypothetical protein